MIAFLAVEIVWACCRYECVIAVRWTQCVLPNVSLPLGPWSHEESDYASRRSDLGSRIVDRYYIYHARKAVVPYSLTKLHTIH